MATRKTFIGNIKGPQGPKGADGKDGYTPVKGVDYFDGQDGKDGSTGPQGANGNDGVGIVSVKQTTTSTADDGNNVITVTLSNGNTSTFTVQNGSKGSQGEQGPQGKDGATGPQGPKGDTGPQGIQGATGSQGPKGDTGPAGKDGSDATVTATNVKNALGYTPAKQDDVDSLSEEIVDLKKRINQSNVQDAQGETVEEALAWLEENGDTSQVYLLPNGNIARYKTIEIIGGIEEVTERITGTFTEDQRLSTSSGNLTSLTGAITTPLIDLTPYGKQIVTIHLDGNSIDTCIWGSTSAVTGNSAVLYNNGTFLWGGYTGYTTHAGVTYKYINKNDVDVIIDLSVMSCTHARFSGVVGRVNTVSVSITYKKETQGGTESKWVDTGRGLISSDYDERLIALESDTASLKVRVKSLEDSIITSDTVPNYVLVEAEEVADKVLSVRNANSFVMALASDLHTNGSDTSSISVRHAGQGMNAINSMTQLDLVALLGDYEIYGFSYGTGDTDGEDARKSFKHAKKCFTDVSKGVPFMMLQGNHDELSTDTTEEARQKYYAYIGANNVGTVVDYNNKFRNYGYRDFENYKIRVIYLNTTDVTDNSVTGNCYVSTEQLNWLNTVALNFTDSEWVPIVLSHHPLNWDGMSSVLNALNTYKGTGKSILHFHGHLHNFRAETLGTNNVPTITIPNACFDRNNEYGTSSSYSDNIKSMYGDVDENGNQRQFNKTSGTENDTAFNVVVIDRENKKIHCFNYGAGIDREISY